MKQFRWDTLKLWESTLEKTAAETLHCCGHLEVHQNLKKLYKTQETLHHQSAHDQSV